MRIGLQLLKQLDTVTKVKLLRSVMVAFSLVSNSIMGVFL